MTSPTPEQLNRVETWIRSEATSKTVDEVHSYVTTRLAKLSELVRSLPEAELRAVPEGQEWSPLDALTHVAEWTSQCGEDILHVSLTGERPGNPLPALDQDPEALLQALTESLASVYAHVSAADPAGFLEVTWEHPFFGQMNWREWHLFLGVHISDHTHHIKELSTSAGA